MNDIETQLGVFAREVYASELSSFYREAWGKEPQSFFDVPAVPITAIGAVPLAERRYVQGKGLVHVTPWGMYEWTVEALAKEHYLSTKLRRPLIMCADSRQALQISVWAYEHDMLPLIGESSVAVTRYAAAHYGIDGMIADAASYCAWGTQLEIPLSIIDDRFASYDSAARSVWHIPGMGALAETCAENPGAGIFHQHPQVYIECGAETIISKTSLLPTPILRWRIPYATKPQTCACGKEGFVLL